MSYLAYSAPATHTARPAPRQARRSRNLAAAGARRRPGNVASFGTRPRSCAASRFPLGSGNVSGAGDKRGATRSGTAAIRPERHAAQGKERATTLGRSTLTPIGAVPPGARGVIPVMGTVTPAVASARPTTARAPAR